jgi:hypothetical protein
MTRGEDILRLSSETGAMIACHAVAGRRREVRGQFRGRLFLQGLRTLTLPSPLRRERRSTLACAAGGRQAEALRSGARVQRINR